MLLPISALIDSLFSSKILKMKLVKGPDINSYLLLLLLKLKKVCFIYPSLSSFSLHFNMKLLISFCEVIKSVKKYFNPLQYFKEVNAELFIKSLWKHNK